MKSVWFWNTLWCEAVRLSWFFESRLGWDRFWILFLMRRCMGGVPPLQPPDPLTLTLSPEYGGEGSRGRRIARG